MGHRRKCLEIVLRAWKPRCACKAPRARKPRCAHKSRCARKAPRACQGPRARKNLGYLSDGRRGSRVAP